MSHHCLIAVCCSLLGLSAAGAAEPFDPLAKTETFTPTVSFSESHSDRLVTTVDRSDPEFPFVNREVVSSESISITVVCNITGIDLSDLDETTTYDLTIGGVNAGGSLGDDLKYSPGKTSIFVPALGFDENDKPIGTQGTRLSWTATRLTITVTGSTASGMPGTVAMEDYTTVPEAHPVLRVIGHVSVGFGQLSSPQRNVYATGRSSFVHQQFGSEAEGSLEEYDLISVSMAGACEYELPVTTLTSPKAGTETGPNATVIGKSTDSYGIEKVEYAVNPNPASPEWEPVTQLNLPVLDESDPPWGKTTATWSISLSGLPTGTNVLWVRSRDISENTSTVLVTTLVNPLATVLRSRWDGLFVPTAASPVRGAFTLSVTSSGKGTGKLFLETGTVPLTGVMGTDGRFTQVVKRPGQPDLTLACDITGANTPGTLMNGSLKDAGGNGATFQAFRSPYTPITMADGTLAGRFHIGVAAPASPVMGQSYVVAITARNGVASASGRMADGSVITWSGALGIDGQLPVFVPLYSTIYLTKGSIAAQLRIDSATRTVPATTLRWHRPLGASDAQFPPGYDLALSASGSAYAAVPNSRVMALPAATPNAQAAVSGDAVPVPFVQVFTVNANNSTLPFLPNPNALAVAAIPASTGLGTASFKLPGTTTAAAVNYLIVGNQAVGHYVAPAIPGTVTKRFGNVTLGAVVH